MYNLIVSNQVSNDGPDSVEVAKGRFLEYTSEGISSPLSSFSIEAVDSLSSWPCLLMEEGRGEEIAWLRRIKSINYDGGDVRILTSAVPTLLDLTNDMLWKLRDHLDIGEFEFSRNHWAVKNRNLPEILVANKLIDKETASAFSGKPIPGASRADLVRARTVLAEWGHTDLDDFLLEVGVAELHADRNVGSRRDRAIKIITHAIEHPEAKTADNHLLSTVIMQRAAPQLPVQHAVEPRASAAAASSSAALSFARDTEGTRSPNRVFIVHGRNDAARNEVISLLARVGLKGIVLHEQPNMGRHLLTKFIDEAELVTFAIVLLTDDDLGGVTRGSLMPRARQNVILELGYFLAHLGQERVCAIKTPGLETPSDFDGIVYISMDVKGVWEGALVRELRAAGMPVVE